MRRFLCAMVKQVAQSPNRTKEGMQTPDKKSKNGWDLLYEEAAGDPALRHSKASTRDACAERGFGSKPKTQTNDTNM